MSKLVQSLIAVAALGLGGMALAQDTTAPATETEAPAETDTPSERADGLSTGAEISEVGKTYVLSEHGDWELRCIKAPDGAKDPCQLYQLLEDQNGNSVAEINLFNLPDDEQLAAGATIVTPLETLLTRQVRLSVDGSNPKLYPFTFCTRIGCFSRIGLTPADIAAFKSGNEALIVIAPAQAPDQEVELKLSLTGFTDGFTAVEEATKP